MPLLLPLALLALSPQEVMRPAWSFQRAGAACTAESPPGDAHLTLVQTRIGELTITGTGPGWQRYRGGKLRARQQSRWPADLKPVDFVAQKRADGAPGFTALIGAGTLPVSAYHSGTFEIADPRSGAQLGPIPVEPLDFALKRLSACAYEIANADPGSGAPAVRDAKLLNSFLSNDDYPPAALRSGDSGRTGIGLTVSAKGKVSDCEVTASSGSALLDETACILYARRARFDPAVDAEGKPTESKLRTSITWTIPS